MYTNGDNMSQSGPIRAAVAQFHVGADVSRNLASCLRALDAAARERPHVVVLPEFANHLSWYDDQAHCRRVSVTLDGPFLTAIADKARAIGAHVVVNVTLNRDAATTTGTSVLFSPSGERLALNDKQVLIGHENDFLAKANEEGPVLDTAFGRAGLYACMDGVINETPRGLALRGADVLLNSLNSFATDEGSLHIPVRAAENKVFVVAANKVGPLVPEDMVGPISEATGIPVHFLDGAGDSQIVAPDGAVLAMAPRTGEAVVFAEFDPVQARNKRRPDGTDVFSARRPALYAPIAADPAGQKSPPFNGPDAAPAALVHAPDATGALKAVSQAFAAGARIVAIAPTPGLDVRAVCDLCPDEAFAAMMTEAGDALLLTRFGVALSQAPLHSTARFGPARADAIGSLPTRLGRIALVAGDDSIFPETFRLLAMTGAEIAVAPVTPLEDWELRTGLIERSAENRVNLLAPAAGAAPGLATALQRDFTVLTPWTERAFDGLLSQPMVTRARGPVTHVTLHPSAAANKVVSRNTDLLAGRPWRLAGALVRP
jgi:predicted amidohydrolase